MCSWQCLRGKMVCWVAQSVGAKRWLRCIVPWYGVPCRGVVWCGVMCRAVVWCAMLWCHVLWCAVVYCAVVHCAALCCAAHVTLSQCSPPPPPPPATICNALAMNCAERRRYYCNALPASHTLVS